MRNSPQLPSFGVELSGRINALLTDVALERHLPEDFAKSEPNAPGSGFRNALSLSGIWFRALGFTPHLLGAAVLGSRFSSLSFGSAGHVSPVQACIASPLEGSWVVIRGVVRL